jgi:hypothetical protein
VTRVIVLVVALVFIIGLAVLTLAAVAAQGFTLAEAVSVAVVAILGVGVVGALLGPRK